MLSRALGFLFHLYNLLILIRIFLSWVPNFDWEQQPFAWIRSIVDPLLNRATITANQDYFDMILSIKSLISRL